MQLIQLVKETGEKEKKKHDRYNGKNIPQVVSLDG